MEKYEISWNILNFKERVTLGLQGMRDGNDLKYYNATLISYLFIKKLTSLGFISETTMPRVTSARRVYIISEYLKFRSEARGGFRIRRWANASSRMHAEGTQASCKRVVWRMPTRVKSSRGNDQAAARFRSRPEPMEEEKRRWNNADAAFTFPFSLVLVTFFSFILFHTGRKRGTATSTWPCVYGTLTGRIRIASFLSSSLAPPRRGYISNSGPVAGPSRKSGGTGTSGNTTRHRMQLWYAYLNGRLSWIASYSLLAVVPNSHIQQNDIILAVLPFIESTTRLTGPSMSGHKSYEHREYLRKLTKVNNKLIKETPWNYKLLHALSSRLKII